MPLFLETAKLTSKGQLTIPATVRNHMGLKAGDTVMFIEDGGKTVMALPNQLEIKLRDGFPVYRAETVNGAAIVPADWDDPEDACYDVLA